MDRQELARHTPLLETTHPHLITASRSPKTINKTFTTYSPANKEEYSPDLCKWSWIPLKIEEAVKYSYPSMKSTTKKYSTSTTKKGREPSISDNLKTEKFRFQTLSLFKYLGSRKPFTTSWSVSRIAPLVQPTPTQKALDLILSSKSVYNTKV